MVLKEDQIEKYKNDGFLVIPNFLSEVDVQALKEECDKLVEEMDPPKHSTVFKTGEKQTTDDYFMTSGDKIRYFFEDGVMNENGELCMDKKMALNKIGHALHWWNPVFKRVTFSNKVKNLAKALDVKDPQVVQSMYIFKNAGTGGKVSVHQDATFLYTEPMRLTGLWFALEDARLDNGCLHFVPRSHKGELRSKWVRQNGSMVTVNLSDNPEYGDHDFVPAIVPKGGCLLIDGLVVHKSSKNSSNKSRPAYTFHIIDKHQSEYSKNNWLQPTDELPFPSLYETELLT